MNDIPQSLNLFLTGKCNLFCKYCFVNKNVLSKRPLEEKLLKKSVDFLLARPGKRKVIGFSGGEPLLEKELLIRTCVYARRMAKKNGLDLRISVATNGVLLDGKTMACFAKMGVETKISIDGLKSIHDKNRPFAENFSKSSFDEIVKNTKKLKKEGRRLAASMVFNPLNIGKLLEGIEFLRKSGFSQIDFFPDMFVAWNYDELKKMNRFFGEFASYYAGLFIKNKRPFRNSFLSGIFSQESVAKAQSCDKINIGPNGEAYVCDKAFFLEPRAKREYSIGNIQKGIDKTKRSVLLKEIRQKFYKASGLECEKCEFFGLCFCPVGHYIISSPQKIFKNKSLRKNFFKSFCSIAKAYIKTFARLERALKFNQKFIDFYSGDARAKIGDSSCG